MWNKKEMSNLDATLTMVPLTVTFDLDIWPWIFKVKLYLGNWSPHCHGTKGRGVDRMPWCETLRKWVNWTIHWLGYLRPWPLTLNFHVKLYLWNGRPDCHGMKGTGVDRMPWCDTQPLCDLEAEDTVTDRGDWRCRRFRRLVYFYYGNERMSITGLWRKSEKVSLKMWYRMLFDDGLCSSTLCSVTVITFVLISFLALISVGLFHINANRFHIIGTVVASPYYQ